MRWSWPLNPRPASSVLLFLRPKPYQIPKPCRCSQAPSMAKSLDEADVGILCYVSSLPGFRGVLKQRYSDFIVNEVDLDGKIIHLTSFDLPPEFSEEKAPEKNPHSSDKDYSGEIEAFRSLSGEVDAESLRDFLEKIVDSEASDVASIILSPDSDKSHRAEVHNFFKRNFKFLVTDTVEEADTKCVRVRFCSGDGGAKNKRGKKRKEPGGSGPKNERPFDSRGSDNWPEHLGKFLRFHLFKENKDTQEALGVIGKMLGVQQRSFGFAGTKDKRSISTQRVTIFKQHAKRLAALNSRLIGIKVGDFCYVKEGLVLGQLMGNRFTITLRGVVAESQDIVKAAADGLSRNGFINYYGLQRFGSGSVPTHMIGAALLKGEWKHAVDLILNPREGERAFVRDARESYKENGDIDMALRQFPRHLVAEKAVVSPLSLSLSQKAVLQCLKKCPGNYLQALKAIPRTLRMMYVHSYQSYLWNHAASERVQRHGIAQVVLGDLVYCKDDTSKKLADIDNANSEDFFDFDNDDIQIEMPETTLSNEQFHLVKVVDSEDLLAGRFNFDDVVLPLPGSKVLYPENDIADVFHEIAKKDGISLTESVHGAKEFSITGMTGDYRRVFQRPVDLVWELLTYTDDNIPLAETDLDVLSKTKPDTAMMNGIISGNSSYLAKKENAEISLDENYAAEDRNKLSTEIDLPCNSDTPSAKTALKLEFTLPSSCYATMAMRELLKASTSVAHQKTINP
ncbi:Pseudouridine synthase TruD protein [Dioscorea alata]|uniref:Pseudouridine synthase TruD protein n=1 Tax=Dioscorea alata TaxID=55571 RepID=A0ACB7UM17_DIOAL|nr:Pseudouridine synthase TruD protein [Dioscorea alata]